MYIHTYLSLCDARVVLAVKKEDIPNYYFVALPLPVKQCWGEGGLPLISSVTIIYLIINIQQRLSYGSLKYYIFRITLVNSIPMHFYSLCKIFA